MEFSCCKLPAISSTLRMKLLARTILLFLAHISLIQSAPFAAPLHPISIAERWTSHISHNESRNGTLAALWADSSYEVEPKLATERSTHRSCKSSFNECVGMWSSHMACVTCVADCVDVSKLYCDECRERIWSTRHKPKCKETV